MISTDLGAGKACIHGIRLPRKKSKNFSPFVVPVSIS